MVRNRVFTAAFSVSTLLHVSAITLFSIVIPFPRQNTHFYTFEIVETRMMADAGGLSGEVLRVRSPAQALAMLDDEEPTAPGLLELRESLPDIKLPTVEFAQLDRLQLSMKGLELGRRFDDLSREKPRDPWARFSDELGRVGGALRELTSADKIEPDTDKPHLVSRPAAGFEVYVEWISGTTDRQLVYAPPIDALWGLDPARLSGSLTFIFSVAPDGRVTEVLPPITDSSDLATDAAITLSKYRFEPLTGDNKNSVQRGTFIISPARSAP